jgi:hypothetical protein
LPSIELSRAVWVPIDRKTGLVYAVLPVSRFLPWHLLTLFPGFREPDRYCLLPAFDLATFSSSPAFRSATLVTSHLTFNVAAGAARIFPLPFLSHSLPLDLSKNSANRLTVWCAGGCNCSHDNPDLEATRQLHRRILLHLPDCRIFEQARALTAVIDPHLRGTVRASARWRRGSTIRGAAERCGAASSSWTNHSVSPFGSADRCGTVSSRARRSRNAVSEEEQGALRFHAAKYWPWQTAVL